MKRQLILFIMMTFAMILSSATISGNVENIAGEPVSNSDIYLMSRNYDDSLYYSTYSEAGAFQLENIPVGSYSLCCFAEGYLSAFYLNAQESSQFFEESTTIEITNENGNYTGYNLFLIPHNYNDGFGGTISGNIITENVIDRVFEISLISMNFDEYYFPVFVDEMMMEFYAYGIPEGEYILQVRLMNDEILYYDNTFNIEEAYIFQVYEGSYEYIELEIPSPTVHQISGMIYDSNDESPIPNAQISVIPSYGYETDFSYEVFSNEDGLFVFDELPAGEYWININAETYQLFEDASAAIAIFEDIENLNFAMTPIAQTAFQISGTIFNEGEIPEFPCFVIAVPSDEDEDWDTTTSPVTNGIYSLNIPSSSECYVFVISSAAPPTYYGDELDWHNATIIDENSTGIDINLTPINPNGSIIVEGEVSGEGRELLSDVAVIFFDSSLQPVAYDVTNSEGFFQTLISEPTVLNIQAIKTHYQTTEIERLIFSNETINLSLFDEITSSVIYTIPNKKNPIKISPNPIKFSKSNKSFSANFSFSLEEDAIVNATIYNIIGQKVNNVINQKFLKGKNTIAWKGNEITNLPSGIYFLKLKFNGEVHTARFTLIK